MRRPQYVRYDGLDVQEGDILNAEETAYFRGLYKLWDMLSDTIQSGRLTESDIPDDYQALVLQMVKLNKLQHKAIKTLNLGL